MSAERLPPVIRSDGARNRARILAAARELFAERSVDEVQLDDIASAAGVARATLYRHIGGRDALIAEVYRGRVADLHRLVLLSLRHDDPWEGFAVFLRLAARWARDDRGFYAYARLVAEKRAASGEMADLAVAVDGVLERVRVTGVMRPRLRVVDLVPLLAFTGSVAAERQDEFVEMLLRGLRA